MIVIYSYCVCVCVCVSMYAVGGLFWVSEVAKSWQEILEKEYNVPTYGVFVILAIATIVVGLTLGGVSVCLCAGVCVHSS